MAKDPSTEALSIYTEMLAGETIPSGSVDITATEFQLPTQVGNPLYDPIDELTITELTTKVVDGDGVFDVIMTTLRAHIIEEYDEGRITGKEYSEAYIAMMTAAMGGAIQFALAKNTASHQNAILQMQARTAEIQAITAAADLANVRQKIVMADIEILTGKASYALSKMRLATEDITYSQIEQQVALTEAEAGIANYRLTNIIPEEKRKITYEIDAVLASQVAKTNFEVSNLMPKQESVLDKEIAIKEYQRTYIMVEQHELLSEQVEVQRAQTMDTRTDGTTAIDGAIGKQKELYSEQILSYGKDARFKAGKLWVDGWITQKAVDEGLLAPDQFTNTKVDEVLASIKTNLSLGTP